MRSFGFRIPNRFEARGALTAFVKKANEGDAEASYVVYYWSTCGAKRDRVNEERLLRLAAQKGNAKARAEMERRGLK
jgi:hypothetical protein